MSYYSPLPPEQTMQEAFNRRLARIFDEMGYTEVAVAANAPTERSELAQETILSPERYNLL